MKISKAILIAMLLICAITVYARFNSLTKENNKNIEYLISLYAERVTAVVKEAADATEILDTLLVAAAGYIPNEEIDTMLAMSYDKSSHFALVYMPKGITERVYPQEGNEELIGYNVFEDETAVIDAKTAIETQEITYSGPYHIVTGENALVARNPVFINNNGSQEFWGFLSAVIRPTESLLKHTGLDNLEELNYEYTIQSSYLGNKVELYSSQNYVENETKISLDFNIGQGIWQISMYENDAMAAICIDIFLEAFAMLTVTILIFIAFRQTEKRTKIAHTQALTDSLTNLYNRRALDKYEERSTASLKSEYTIYYLDLNMFKPVNDTYGHEIGDKLLALFAERLLSQFRKDTFISRVGGDEFVIIFPLKQHEEDSKQVKSRLLRLSENPFYIDGHEIRISSSIGCASYPKDGKDFAEVLAIADKDMFENKKLHKKKR